MILLDCPDECPEVELLRPLDESAAGSWRTCCPSCRRIFHLVISSGLPDPEATKVGKPAKIKVCVEDGLIEILRLWCPQKHLTEASEWFRDEAQLHFGCQSCNQRFPLQLVLSPSTYLPPHLGDSILSEPGLVLEDGSSKSWLPDWRLTRFGTFLANTFLIAEEFVISEWGPPKP